MVVILNNFKLKYKRSLYLIPFFFTFANAMLGLLAVFKTLNSEFITAAYCILLATFCDCLDGRLARKFNTTTMLGMELDSLCDAISFCMAPAVLLYSWEVQEFGTIGLICLMIYLCAGLLRLARFNVISDSADNIILGLPTTVAAFFITCLVLCENSIPNKLSTFLLQKNVLLPAVFLIAFLMISKIPFPSFKQSNLIVLPMTTFIIVGVLGGYSYLLLIPSLYIFTGCTKGCYFGAKRLVSKSKIKQKFV